MSSKALPPSTPTVPGDLPDGLRLKLAGDLRKIIIIYHYRLEEDAQNWREKRPGEVSVETTATP